MISIRRPAVVGGSSRAGPISRRVVRCSGLSRGHRFASTERSRPRRSGDGWLAMICRRPQFRISPCSLNVLHLYGWRRQMPVPHRNFILTSGAGPDPTLAAVVTHPIHIGGVVHYCRVVNVVNVGDVHVRYREVIEEASVIPPPAFEAFSEVSIAVTDAAVKPDMRAPVAVVEGVASIHPRPIRWSPQIAHFRCHDPCSGHPVVVAVVIAPGPVAWCPDIAIAGTERLLVNGQCRGPKRTEIWSCPKEAEDRTNITNANQTARMERVFILLSPVRAAFACPIPL